MTLDLGEPQKVDLVPRAMGRSPLGGAAVGEGEDQGSLGVGIQGEPESRDLNGVHTPF